MNALCSWSGGKDSCYALMQAIDAGYKPAVLLNVLNEKGMISRSHGIPSDILLMQANYAGIPIHLISSSWADYEQQFTSALNKLKKDHQLEYAVFGDIDLQAHRDWEEKVCTNADLKAVLPLWHRERRSLLSEMLLKGIDCRIVSCNAIMGERFIGKQLTESLADELTSMGIDACGENGEFHTLVVNCPLFSEALNISIPGAIEHEGYWFAGW